jgi:hypothetical protein
MILFSVVTKTQGKQGNWRKTPVRSWAFDFATIKFRCKLSQCQAKEKILVIWLEKIVAV